MPYRVFKTEEGYCVYKVNKERQPVGKSKGCHDTKVKAINQIIAINMSENNPDKVIMHYGVIGMRWGRRRARTQSQDSKTASGLKKKKTKELSNAELEKINKRLNLERQYKSLNPTKLDLGKKFVLDIVGNAGKMVLTTAAVGLFTKVGKTVIEKALKGG